MRSLFAAALVIPLTALALTAPPPVRSTDEGTQSTADAGLRVPSFDRSERVRVEAVISYIRYLFEPKQALILPSGNDPFFFFAYNDNLAHVTTVVFNESEFSTTASWTYTDIVTWTSATRLRYVSPSAYEEPTGGTWYPQVTFNTYNTAGTDTTHYLYDTGGVGAGAWSGQLDVEGPTYDYYLPLTEAGPGNVVYMDGQARDVAGSSHVFKSFNGTTGTIVDPPGEEMIFPSSSTWGPDPVYGQGYENSQLVYRGNLIVILLGGFRTNVYTDPNNPLLVAYRASSDGGNTWTANTWLDQLTVPDLPGLIPGIQGHYSNSFFDALIDQSENLHVLAAVCDSGYYGNSSELFGLYDMHQVEGQWAASQITDGTYPTFDPRALLGGDSWIHSPSTAEGADGTLIACWNDMSDTATTGSTLTGYNGIWMSLSHDGGMTWSDEIKVAGQAGQDEYFSRLVPTTTAMAGADSGYAYVLTMPVTAANQNGPLDIVRMPYMTLAPPELTGTPAADVLTLSWNAVGNASSYKIYLGYELGFPSGGAANLLGETSSITFDVDISTMPDAVPWYFVARSVAGGAESLPSDLLGAFRRIY
jgi:hypothetical protein